MKKQNVMPIVILSAICVVVALLLSVVNMFTAPIIAENAAKKETESMSAVLEGAVGFEKLTLTDLPETVSAVYEETTGLGFVVFVKTKTSYTHGEDMAITVGINKEGKVVGVKLTSYTESKDIGPDYPNRFVGLDASNVGEVDAVAGVTYSSNAFKNAVKDALAAVESLVGTAKDEMTLKAEKLITGANLSEISGKFDEGASRVWKDKNGGGYVVLVTTKTQYVNPDTETLVAVGLDGKVIGIKILKWVHGENISYTEAFEGSFDGKDSAGVDGVDVITGATGTSNNVKNAVKLAISVAMSIEGGN